MSGYVAQETYTAGENVSDEYNATNSWFGTLDTSLTNLIKCIFFDSRVEYQVQQQRNSHIASLQTWVSTALDEKATETASMDIENVNLNSIEMAALIDERAQVKINQIVKKFDNKLKQMENQLKQSKNDRRENAANSRSQPNSKKNNNNNNNKNPTGGGCRSHQKKKEKGQKADDVDNASGSDKKNNRNKNSKGKGKKNKKS